jgi:soluble lytic murein transglycosylase
LGFFFRPGLELFRQREYEAAVPLLVKSVNSYPLLADHASYYLAESLFQLKQWEKAKKQFEGLIKGYPDSVWIQLAALRLGEVSLDAGKPAEATHRLRQFINDYPDSELAPEARLKLAQAYRQQGQELEAYQAWMRLWVDFPLSRQAKSAESKLDEMAGKGFKREPAPRDWLKRVGKMVKGRQYKDAVEELKTIAQTSLLREDGTFRRRVWLKLGLTLARVKRYDKARNILAGINRGFPASDEARASLYWQMRLASRQGKGRLARELGGRFLSQFPKSSLAAKVLFVLARLAEQEGKEEEASPLYSRIIAEHPADPLALTARWRLGWLSYRRQAWEKAASHFSQLAQASRQASWSERAGFWQGRVLEKLGDKDKAKQIYFDLATRVPLTYYGFQARERFKRLWPESISPLVGRRDGDVDLSSPAMEGDNIHLDKASELSRLGLIPDAKREMYRVLRDIERNRSLIIPVSSLFSRIGDFNRSHLIIRKYFGHIIRSYPGNNTPRLYWQLGYPQGYKELVIKHARQNRLPPELVFAIVREESAFDPDALSRSGAIGLMQILPPTGKYLADETRQKNFSPLSLYDPVLNIQLGSFYISRLLERFSNDKVLAIAGYNAGPNAVSKWVEKKGYSDQEEFVEEIPYRETRLYVKRVLRSYFAYQALYAELVKPND